MRFVHNAWTGDRWADRGCQVEEFGTPSPAPGRPISPARNTDDFECVAREARVSLQESIQALLGLVLMVGGATIGRLGESASKSVSLRSI
jgi:hypothetical protein